MTAILERRESTSLWGRFCNWITNPTAARRNPVPPSRAPQPKSSRAPRAAESRGLGDPEGSRSSGGGAAGSGGKQAPVVAKSSASGAAAVAGLAAMITRSKLVEQLRDYQIRSQHKRDIIGAISWGLLCCFLIISSYMTLYFRHFWLSAVIISLGILLPAGLYILRQRKLAKKRERRLLLPLSM